MKNYLLIFVVVCLVSPCAYAENETTNERLIRVETSIKSIDKRIDVTNKRIDETNTKIDLLRQDMNMRFEESNRNINKRLDFFGTLMIFTIGSLFTVIALICGLIAYIFFDRKKAAEPATEKIAEIQIAHKESIRSIKENFDEKIKQIWDVLNKNSQSLSPA